MNLNKDLFFSHLNSKDYDYCISLLRSEIIDILTSKIQEKNSNFKYTNIGILKTYSFKYLNEEEQHICCRLYDFSHNDFSSSYELSQLLEIYKTLIDSNFVIIK